MPTGPRPSPPVGVCKVDYRWTFGDSFGQNVFWTMITGALTYANIATFATDMYGAYQTTLLTQMNNTANLQECICTYYDGAGNPQGSSSSVHPGGHTSAPAIANAAAVLSWKIPASYRGGKPRTYIGGLSTGDFASTRTLSSSEVGNMETSALAFLTAVNGITLTGVTGTALGTVSFQHLGAWRTPPIFYSYIAVGVQQRICTQRRRLGAELF